MSEYDKLLDKARKAKEVFRASAGEFVPKMYEALKMEGVDPADAKDRIEKDLAGIWEKDTIRRFIPDEAKNQEQSSAARRVNKERQEKAGKNPAPVIQVAEGGAEEVTISNSPKVVSDSYSPGAKPDRTATYTERQTALIADLKSKLFSAQNVNSELRRKIASMEKSGYAQDNTQELIDALKRVQELEEPFEETVKVEFGRFKVPVKIKVRPARKEIASVIILEQDIPAGAF